MADSIKIGTSGTTFKVGSDDVSAIYLGNTLVYSGGTPHDYSQDYFTIVSEEDNNTISLKNTGYDTSSSSNAYWRSVTISASTDGGSTWSKFTTSRGGTATFGTINKGDKILFKSATSKFSNTNSAYHYFNSTKNINAEGNILSLIYGDNFLSYDSLPSISTKEKNRTQQLGCIFKNNTKIISAKNLILKPTTLSPKCYASMFANCTSLTAAPELPATTTDNFSYQGMFDGCISLAKATISIGTSSTTIADHCCYAMFQGCTSLTTAPELPATTLANSCYTNMFTNCTSLTTAPTTLPATTLASSCYDHMFLGCTSLTTAPSLPATALTVYCYSYMFQGCTSLTTAPSLPATALTNYCYSNMFNGCTSLNSITCLATDISASNCTTNWVNGVAASGTFTKTASMTSWSTGNNGIPSGWTVEDVPV